MPPPGLHPVRLTDLADPRLADYAGLRHAHLVEEARAADGAAAAGGVFIAEGDLVLGLLVGSRFRIRSVLVSERRVEGLEPTLARLAPGTPVYTVDQAAMNELVGFNIHRGVLAVAERGPGLTAEDVIGRSEVLVVMEDLANHDNVGGIFRCTAALGGPRAGVLLSPRCADPLYRKAVRVSMGHVLRVPFAVMPGWPGGLRAFAARGFQVVGLTPAGSAVDLGAMPVPGRVALVVGTEGPGLSEGAAGVISQLGPAGRLARIAMTEGVDSLNVMVAAAVALHRLVVPSEGGTGPGPDGPTG